MINVSIEVIDRQSKKYKRGADAANLIIASPLDESIEQRHGDLV
jgi:hypothetical protein